MLNAVENEQSPLYSWPIHRNLLAIFAYSIWLPILFRINISATTYFLQKCTSTNMANENAVACSISYSSSCVTRAATWTVEKFPNVHISALHPFVLPTSATDTYLYFLNLITDVTIASKIFKTAYSIAYRMSVPRNIQMPHKTEDILA